jgi:hypothetical protein
MHESAESERAQGRYQLIEENCVLSASEEFFPLLRKRLTHMASLDAGIQGARLRVAMHWIASPDDAVIRISDRSDVFWKAVFYL